MVKCHFFKYYTSSFEFVLILTRWQNQCYCWLQNCESMLGITLTCDVATYYPTVLRRSWIAPLYHPRHIVAFLETIACTLCSNPMFQTLHILPPCSPQVSLMFARNLWDSSCISPLDTSNGCAQMNRSSTKWMDKCDIMFMKVGELHLSNKTKQ
jgi:hypothetical protein